MSEAQAPQVTAGLNISSVSREMMVEVVGLVGGKTLRLKGGKHLDIMVSTEFAPNAQPGEMLLVNIQFVRAQIISPDVAMQAAQHAGIPIIGGKK